jgi:hypothetical protein
MQATSSDAAGAMQLFDDVAHLETCCAAFCPCVQPQEFEKQ